MKDKFDEDDKLFAGLYYHLGKHRVDNISQHLENVSAKVEDLPYPEELNHWFNGFLKEQEKEEKAIQNKKKFQFFAKNVAIFMLLFTSGLALTTFSVEAFRTKVFNMVSEITEKYSKIEFVETESPANGSVVVPWDFYFYPEYLPKGFALESTQQLGDVKLIYFADSTGKNIEFSQSPSISSFQVDTENAQTKKITLHDGEGLIIYKDGMTTMVWTRSENTLYLIGTLSEEAFIQIAESVVVKNK